MSWFTNNPKALESMQQDMDSIANQPRKPKNSTDRRKPEYDARGLHNKAEALRAIVNTLLMYFLMPKEIAIQLANGDYQFSIKNFPGAVRYYRNATAELRFLLVRFLRSGPETMRRELQRLSVGLDLDLRLKAEKHLGELEQFLQLNQKVRISDFDLKTGASLYVQACHSLDQARSEMRARQQRREAKRIRVLVPDQKKNPLEQTPTLASALATALS